MFIVKSKIKPFIGRDTSSKIKLKLPALFAARETTGCAVTNVQIVPFLLKSD